jgi:hypothetical protein
MPPPRADTRTCSPQRASCGAPAGSALAGSAPAPIKIGQGLRGRLTPGTQSGLRRIGSSGQTTGPALERGPALGILGTHATGRGIVRAR